jgi:uncharacterized repeat protein (TIGR01451 family)
VFGKGSPNPVLSGGQITYTLTVSNVGTTTATNIVFTDAVPSGTTFVSVSSPTASCSGPASGGTGTVQCSQSSLLSRQNLKVTMVVTVTAASGSTVTDTSQVQSREFDSNLANNVHTIKTAVQ